MAPLPLVLPVGIEDEMCRVPSIILRSVLQSQTPTRPKFPTSPQADRYSPPNHVRNNRGQSRRGDIGRSVRSGAPCSSLHFQPYPVHDGQSSTDKWSSLSTTHRVSWPPVAIMGALRHPFSNPCMVLFGQQLHVSRVVDTATACRQSLFDYFRRP